MPTPNEPVDLFIIGGGINGCGIARDAAGRGYRVALAEMNDLASATSSGSTKLFHGGLRYLEFFEFRLVREALIERETLLQAMPHISWPMRFILPTYKEMRFESDTPTSKLLSFFMPWMRGRRPNWLIRFGLFLYDHLGGRKILPGTSKVDLRNTPEGAPLKSHLVQAYEYSDCWVEDARLTLLNARDAEARGADILVRHRVTRAEFVDGLWNVSMEDELGKAHVVQAKMLVNAGGPWVETIIKDTINLTTQESIRLVRGSHIVTKKLYDHDKCYFFQGEDGRIIFAIPYEEDFTLIGTTDADHSDPFTRPECSTAEADYLREFAGKYFEKPIKNQDIVWRYSGVRPLYNDGASSATAATREYVLRVNHTGGGPVLNIFGGKITTYRRLAEAALEHIDDVMDRRSKIWTAGVALPGGDFAVDGVDDLRAALQLQLPFMPSKTIRRLIRQYGTEAAQIFVGATCMGDLGCDFGDGITARELDWAVRNEWVCTADDFLWRRSKLGLRVTEEQTQKIDAYIASARR
ncbi:glycerol-3-phosphate dehydrogenase [Halocynthiibacter namhaensis]|uniref:glycerol-3-phosphate dehydrogenase n=1 Tax=Halocynthiibacter namhaensis TaxID=1290553 RepID=UPI0005792FB5|nr:glycerol-3-phosphate dehydrogenase [Halocynthiibacter namhaensis]